MSGEKRVIFVNRTYPPYPGATGQLLRDLAPALARTGYKVIVVTAGTGSVVSEDGVTVHRIGAAFSAQRRISLWDKWRAQRLFFNAAKTWWETHIQSADTVVIMTDPPSLSGQLGNCPRGPRPRLVHWVQDIHPEVGAALTFPPARALIGRWSRARNRAWRQADAVVTLGTDMAAVIANLNVARSRLHISPNWAPRWLEPVEDALGQASREQRGWTGKFVVMYSGNLGRVHDMEAIIAVASRLRSRRDIVFCLVGDGAQIDRLKATVASRQLEQVMFLPPQPTQTVSAMLSAADLHLVTLKESCAGLVWPSKFYGILAVQRPVLFIGPVSAEIGQQIKQHRLGWAGARDKVDEAGSWIEALVDDHTDRPSALRSRVAAYHHSHLGFERSLAWWQTFLS